MSEKMFIYLDHAASTPVAPEVLQAMLPYFSEVYGNPSGLHRQGQACRRAISQARQETATLLNCTPREIIFTSGGTESDNLAIRGIARRQMLAGKGNHLITSAIEHSAVSKTIDWLCEYASFTQTKIPVDNYGRVDPAAVVAAIRPETVLISIMAVNNEVGTLQPVAEIGRMARQHAIPFHTDAVQAVGAINLDTQQLSVDALALSAHKFYGPKGVGLLYLKQGTPFMPHSTGAGHEEGRRPGTENVPGIVGLARALALAIQNQRQKGAALARLRDRLIEGVLTTIPGAYLTGHPVERLPNNASFVFEDCDASAILMHLDMHRIGAASGSACSTGMPEPSGVLLAMGLDYNLALGALRLTLGQSTTPEAVDYVLEVLPQVIKNVRQAGKQAGQL